MPAQGKYFIPTLDVSAKDVRLPSSGGLVQVQPLTVEDMVELDVLEQMDLLGGIVQTDHIERVQGTKKPTDRPKKKPTKAEKAKAEADEDERSTQLMKDLMGDPVKWGSLRTTIDRIVHKAVLQPSIGLAYHEDLVDGKTKFTPHSNQDRAERDNDRPWTDQLPLEDKMHLFSVCLPSQDKMAPFREGSTEDVGDVADVAEDAVSAE